MIELQKGKYKIYHIPGVKIGCTTNVKKRVEEEQGYKPDEYDILYETDDIVEASEAERNLAEKRTNVIRYECGQVEAELLPDAEGNMKIYKIVTHKY